MKRLALERTCAAHLPAEVRGLGLVREALLDPSLVRKTNAQENERSQDPMIWATVAAWQNLAAVLVHQNTCELIEFDETPEVNGRKVLSGLTGVAKAGNDRRTVPQRLIMHIKLTSWDQNVVIGDMPQFPTCGRWRCSVLESGVTLVWFGEDLKRCFYVVEIPKPRRTCVAFTAPEGRGLFFQAAWAKTTSVQRLYPRSHTTRSPSFADFIIAPSALPRTRG